MRVDKTNIWSLLFAGISAIGGVVVIARMGKTSQQPVTNVFPPLNTESGTATVASPADTQLASTPNVTTSTQGVSKLPVQPIYTI